MGSYKLTEKAIDDLAHIYSYGIEVFGAARADLYYDTLLNHLDRLAENPYLYPALPYIRPGYRRSVCGVDSIYYRVVDDTVEIVRILGRQDFESLL